MLPTDSVLDDAPARRRAGVAAGSMKQHDPTPATEDVPASTYARLERSVVAWLVADNVLYTFASLSKKSVRLPFLLMENLMFPICLSVCMLYAFGTLDSSAVRKRVVVIWVSFMLYQAVFSFIFCWVQGYPLARAVGITVFFVLIAAGFSWLIGIIRDELRALGSLDASRIKRLFEIMGIQLALVVVGATQGLGRGDMPRIVGTVTFSQSLTMAWFYSLAIFGSRRRCSSGRDPLATPAHRRGCLILHGNPRPCRICGVRRQRAERSVAKDGHSRVLRVRRRDDRGLR